MPETAVADTGPPLHLAQVEQESQLTVFVWSSISAQVREELARRGVFDRVAAALADCLVVESVTLSEMDAQRETLRSFRLHQTDLSVAALETPEEAGLAWLTSTISRWTDAPWLQRADRGASSVSDVRDRHNAYIGQH